MTCARICPRFLRWNKTVCLLLISMSAPSICQAFSASNQNLKNPSSSTSTKNDNAVKGGKWSPIALETARGLTQTMRQKLYDEGIMEWKYQQPVRIQAQRLDLARPEQWLHDENDKNDKDTTTITKILHFQRHGQGFHNVLCEQWREFTGHPVPLDSTDPKRNPMVRPEVLDAPLTEIGRQQCRACHAEASLLNPEAIVVSPLVRALQSAELSWAAHLPTTTTTADNSIPWIAHEGCREEVGLLVCNQRRPISELKLLHPQVDFSLCQNEQDTLFIPDRMETALEKTHRVYDFLLDLKDMPQTELAVVGHSAWLFHMCNAVMDIVDDEDETNNCDNHNPSMSSWFLTSEIRSMKVTFQEQSLN